ncbi:hypothetical protein FACS189413_13170 [Bacteroidia bacterium]|nr:hypothetical protein FACS189413_13170 [Bacteroidia bacterium]
MLRRTIFSLLLFCSPVVSAQQNTIEKLDTEMVSNQQTPDENTLWVDAKTLSIEGQGWKNGLADFTRLPDKFQATVTSNVWNLSRHSAGLAVHFFVTGTSFIEAKWTLTENRYMAHMTSVGVNGLDLYVKQNGKWQWGGIAKPEREGLEQKTLIRKGFLPEKTYECMLYLPLYTGISALELGFSPQSKVTGATNNEKKPMVFYGTSILHGCSASRAGMPFVAMLGRQFELPVVNLGFSGNGKMENYFADILSEVEASIYVIDCLPNMSGFSKDEITNRVLTLIRNLRKHKTDTPIILVEDRTYTHPNLTGKPVQNHRREGQQSAYEVLKNEITDLYYVEGDALLGDDNEAAVDGSHPSDLGMYRYYTVLKPVIAKALNAKDSLAIVQTQWETLPVEKGIVHKHFQFPMLYQRAQNINIIEIDTKVAQRKAKIIMADSCDITSNMAKNNHAIVAINASYYNEKTFESVSYYRIDKKVMSYTAENELFRVNGALLIKNGKIDIIPWSPEIEKNYNEQKGEVLASGPLLIRQGESLNYDISGDKFYDMAHPRSAIGITHDNKLLLLTVDGRFEKEAVGVTISELTQLMKLLDCKEALNLDGGRSTTLWSHKAPDNGVLNYPAWNKVFDHYGERCNNNTLIIY